MLYACAGQGGSAITVIPTLQTAHLTATTLSFTIPAAAPKTQAKKRRPQYISAATQSIAVSLTAVNGATPSPLPTAQVVNITTTTGGCGPDTNNTGNTVCTVTLHVPIGADTLTVSTYDANSAAGNLLSQQIYAANVTASNANTFSFALDANPSNATVTVTSTGNATGNQSQGFSIANGSGPATFSVSLADADGDTLVGPGLPSPSPSSDNTSVATVSMSGTTLTITPTIIPGTAHITLTESPANSQGASDGLAGGSVTFGFTVTALIIPTSPPIFDAGFARSHRAP